MLTQTHVAAPATQSRMAFSMPAQHLRTVRCYAPFGCTERSRPALASTAPARPARRSNIARGLYGSDATEGLSAEVYMCLGVAQCFEKGPDGKLQEKLVIEPISASSLECMAAGSRTSFRHVTGVTLGDAITRNRSALPAEFQSAPFCDKYDARAEAAARTWQRPHAQDNLMDIVPLGKVKSNFNFNLDDKRVLNFDNVVSDDDNVKQDISIDVYGRKEKEALQGGAKGGAAAPSAAEEAAAAEQQKEDDLEALLLA